MNSQERPIIAPKRHDPAHENNQLRRFRIQQVVQKELATDRLNQDRTNIGGKISPYFQNLVLVEPDINVNGKAVENYPVVSSELLARMQLQTSMHVETVSPADFLKEVTQQDQKARLVLMNIRYGLQRVLERRREEGQEKYSVAVNMDGSLIEADLDFVTKDKMRIPTIADYILFKLNELGLPGDAIVIEVLEGDPLRDTPETRREVEKLHRNNVHFAMDDVDSGLHTWNQVKKQIRLFGGALRKIKFDSAFLKKPKRLIELMKAVVRGGRDVVVEGIEFDADLQMLQAFANDTGVGPIAQGFKFHKPEKLFLREDMNQPKIVL